MRTDTKSAWTIDSITRENGVAGQYGYRVRTHHDRGPAITTLFIGSEYGGPIFMNGSRIEAADRFGNSLTPEFIRRFYGST